MTTRSQTARASELTLRTAASFGKIDAAAWDACANPRHGCRRTGEGSSGNVAPTAEDPFNPFISHAFLNALERSGSATPRTGWGTCPLLVEGADGTLMACAPAYLKSHSMGEYVFDHAFADAYERAGGRYYPKVQAAVPFTPVSGRRLLVRPGPSAETARQLLIGGFAALMRQTKASSTHVTFATRADWEALAGEGFLQRMDRQFHWFNAGYDSFDDFLAALASRKRKAIKRERREALAN